MVSKLFTWRSSSLVKSSLNSIHLSFCKEAKEHHFTKYNHLLPGSACWLCAKKNLARNFPILSQKLSSPFWVPWNGDSDLCCLLEGKLHLPRLGWLPLGWHRDWLLLSFRKKSCWFCIQSRWGRKSGLRNKKRGLFIYQLQNRIDTTLTWLLGSYLVRFHCKVIATASSTNARDAGSIRSFWNNQFAIAEIIV